MPNWCFNAVRITGPADKIKEVTELAKAYSAGETKQFFQTLVPAIEPVPEDLSNSDWWDSRISLWGTKWEPSNIYIGSGGETSTVLEFDTAWGPPMGILNHLSKDFEVSAAYYEPNMYFAGYYHGEPDTEPIDEFVQMDKLKDWELRDRFEAFFNVNAIVSTFGDEEE